MYRNRLIKLSPPNNARPRASIAIVILAVLAVLYTLWAAQEVILPILLAAFFAMIANPILRGLKRLHVPRFLGALLLLIVGVVGATALGAQLAGPAREWARQAPSRMGEVSRQIQRLIRPVMVASQAAESLARATGGESARRIQVVRTQLDDPYRTLLRTPKFITSVLAVVLLTFFFTVYGENLRHNAIALLPRREQQRFATHILRELEREISRYILTISIINSLVGLILAGALSALRIRPQEALLWGTIAALLNFAPYVGPLLGVVLMLLVGFLQFSEPTSAVIPAAVYLLIHIVEGQVITPIVLGRRMALSPLILILGLMLLGWLWGLVGLLLTVPLLVCIKMLLQRIEGLEGWARLLQ